MRTKTLLIAVAALAVGVLTSSAQTYSQNIVGFVTQTLPYNGSTLTSHGWANVCNTLDLSAGNSLTNIFPNPGPGAGANPLDFDKVFVWNGTGFTVYTIDSDYASGVGDAGDNDNVEPFAPTINPGSLIYILNNGGNISTPSTNVLVGAVHVDALAAGTQTVGSTTNILTKGFNFVASKLPIGGGLTSVLQLTNPVVGGNGGPNGGTGPLDFSLVSIPNIVNGHFIGFTTYTIDSDYASGWADSGDNGITSEPTVPVGVGIIIDYVDNLNQGPYYWIQQY